MESRDVKTWYALSTFPLVYFLVLTAFYYVDIIWFGNYEPLKLVVVISLFLTATSTVSYCIGYFIGSTLVSPKPITTHRLKALAAFSALLHLSIYLLISLLIKELESWFIIEILILIWIGIMPALLAILLLKLVPFIQDKLDHKLGLQS